MMPESYDSGLENGTRITPKKPYKRAKMKMPKFSNTVDVVRLSGKEKYPKGPVLRSPTRGSLMR
jgi:hypothetical protein